MVEKPCIVSDVRKGFYSELRDAVIGYTEPSHGIDMGSPEDPKGNNKAVTHKQPD